MTTMLFNLIGLKPNLSSRFVAINNWNCYGHTLASYVSGRSRHIGEFCLVWFYCIW